MTMDARQVQRYQEISIAVPSEEVDPVANYIIENITQGLVLEDKDGSSSTIIKFYIAAEDEIASRLAGLKEYLAAINPDHEKITVNRKKTKNLDWIGVYRKSVSPFPVGDSIVIKPPWNRETFPGRVEILLEPKMAFGTGRHETTRGMLVEMETIDFLGRSMLDIGCGSGILGVYAALKGAFEVLAYDIDPMAIENSRENFKLNKVESVCRAELGSIGDVPVNRRFDAVVANIIKSVIVPIIGPLKSHTRPGGVMILSGLLDQDREEIENTLQEHNLYSFSFRRDAEWLTYSIQVE
jgi:ribosomal protein L11 methyltransferase